MKKFIILLFLFYSGIILPLGKIAIWADWGMHCGIAQYSEHIYKALTKRQITVFKYPHSMHPNDILKKVIQDKISIFNIQFDYVLVPNKQFFLILLKELRNKGIKIIITVHDERHENSDFLKAADHLIFHKQPTIFKEKPYTIIKFPIPTFEPAFDKNNMRKKYGFLPQQKIISTTGFIFPEKNLPEILYLLNPHIKKDKQIRVQFLNAISNRMQAYCQNEANRLAGMIKKLGLNNQVIFISKFLPQQELSERLYLSDVGFTWFNKALSSISATEKEFVSARLPFIANINQHFDIQSGVIKVANNFNIFANSIINLLNNKTKQQILKAEAESFYRKFNYDVGILQYINIFKKVSGG